MNFNVNCEMFNVIFFKLLSKKFLIVFTLIIMFIFLLKKLYNKFVVINKFVTNSSPKPNLCLIGSLFTKVIIYHNAKYASRVKYMFLSYFSVAS